MEHSLGSTQFDASLLESIIESAPDAIITIKSSGEILSFSPAAEAMFGYTAAEIVGKNVKILMPEPFQAEHDGYLARYLSTGEKRIIGIGREVRAKRKSGEVFAAELAVGELTSNQEKIFTGFIRDVSERVEAVRKAARLQRSLDQMSRTQMLGEMSTALAHEINQPLSAISNFSRAARRTLDAPEGDAGKLSEYLDRIAEQAQRAGEIIRRMRRMIERGQADLVPDDINDIIQDAMRTNLGLSDTFQQIHLELADDLPMVLADRVQIQQVINNLVRNAHEAIVGDDYAEIHVATEMVGAIRLRARKVDGEDVMITVSDTGPGLPGHLAEQLFEPFVTGKTSGIGVGLAVCRSIISAHGGEIWAENGPNGGAEFHFTLPVAGRL